MPSVSPPTDRVSTGGAWLACAVAARGAFLSIFGSLSVALLLGLPGVLEAVQARMKSEKGNELPPEFSELFDLYGELLAVMRTPGLVTGALSAAVGVLLFASAIGFAIGSDPFRRACRLLLVLDGVLVVVSAVWTSMVIVEQLPAWFEKLQALQAKLAQMGPGPAPPTIHMEASAAMNAAMSGCVAMVTLCVLATGVWLAGRPFARDWCAARSRRYPVASPRRPG